jgi:hypothetical protein
VNWIFAVVSRLIWLPITLSAALACERGSTERAPAERAPAERDVDAGAPAAVDSGFASAPDSAWVDVNGLTLIGFYPIASNERLERDADLATVLDDFAYHIGTAMDSLVAAGATVQYRGGDTLWMRSPGRRSRFVRPADSADVGYVLTDTAGNLAILYGVRTYVDLIEYVHEFKSTGRVRPR